MSKKNNETKASDGSEIEYGFLVFKTTDGNTVVDTLKNEDISDPPTINDIYSACDTVCRNVQAQQTAQAMTQAMSVAAQQAQQNKRESGLVVPK